MAERVINWADIAELAGPDALWKTAIATAAGDSAIWTPASGKKYRLLAYGIEVPGNTAAAAAQVVTATLRDGTTDLSLTHSFFVPAAAPTVATPNLLALWIVVGSSIKGSAVNIVLNCNLSVALTAGGVRIRAVGTEE